MSCKINTSDQCFINKKMSYFTFLCGPLSLGCMMECQIILWSSTCRRVIECACQASCVAYEMRPQPQRSRITVTNYCGELFQRQPLTFLLGSGGLCVPCTPQTCRVGWW